MFNKCLSVPKRFKFKKKYIKSNKIVGAINFKKFQVKNYIKQHTIYVKNKFEEKKKSNTKIFFFFKRVMH